MNFLTFTLLLSINFYLSLQQAQDLCSEAKANGFTFANDPASCSGYLYCANIPNIVPIVYQLTCDDPAYPNFFEDGCYSNDPITGIQCVDSVGTFSDSDSNNRINLCPAAMMFQNKSIVFADKNDDSCRKYALCRVNENAIGMEADTINWQMCPEHSTFDRNKGRCSKAYKAPCGSINSAPKCPLCYDGYNVIDCFDCNPKYGHRCEAKNLQYISVPGSCQKYAICYGGKQIGENECDTDLTFNPFINNCDKYENLNYPCPWINNDYIDLNLIPRAQPKSRNEIVSN